MPELQIKLLIGNVDINLQGDSTLVYKIFKELREEGLGVLNNKEQPININTDLINNKEQKTISSSVKKTIKRKNNSKQPQLVKNLDLKNKKNEKSLIEFMNEKKPKDNIGRTTVFIYYLQNILQISDITIDHVFTCYREAGVKIPNNLQQNLFDIASKRYGYIETKDSKFTLSTIGINYVEHELPKKVKHEK